MRPGAPVIHRKGAETRIRNSARNIVAELHSHVGDVEAGFAEADFVHEGTYVTQRVQHCHLETHCAIGWLDATGRLNIRSSTQVPFLTRRALSALLDLDLDKVRVFCERVGGGFGGKQEMLVEDIVALAGVYRCANKKIDGYAVYTNTMPSGAFRGYGLPQTNFAVEQAIDALARGIGMDPIAFRRRNVVQPGDPLISTGTEESDVAYGSYGLD